MTFKASLYSVLLFAMLFSCTKEKQPARTAIDFNSDWKFSLVDNADASTITFDDSKWRSLNLPHDWSIEGSFDEKNPAGFSGGALPGGTGWYRKEFTLPAEDSAKRIFIQFDGVYRNSDVWINGHHLGMRPNGYISFQYELTSYLMFGTEPNVLAVRVDNSQQPNSRWYSGSGIYRDVVLVKTNPVHIAYNGTVIQTPTVSESSAVVAITSTVRNEGAEEQTVSLTTTIYDPHGNNVGDVQTEKIIAGDSAMEICQQIQLEDPQRWSLETPHLYKAVTTVVIGKEISDSYETKFGIRSFSFDSENGFSLNGERLKIKGVCLHHDLGCLGVAFNERAAERQLEIMKAMGVNAVRTSHNPPASKFLDLCDRMGFIVMDEAFDMWKKQKTEFDYHLYWDEWHVRDLEDQVKRDRNHPSVIIWSIGNEVNEQWDHADSLGTQIAEELAGIIKRLDPTRPITAGCNDTRPSSPLIRSNALDLIGYNYAHESYKDFPSVYPGRKFIATETNSALATRGYYDMPSDSIRVWPRRWDIPFTDGHADHTVSAYDNVRTPWGSTQEETWKIMKKYDFLSGMFIWTGFDYIGEPTPYGWPSRSSYFGVVDLAGFPKDTYYMYQSEWTTQTMLHVFPHWNWKEGELVDVWAYYNNADEVELFLNDQSLGAKHKDGDDLHVMWRIPFKAGTLKAISRKEGREVLTKEIHTAGKASRIVLEADRNVIASDGKDLSFVTVKIVDENGILVPDAQNNVQFEISGEGSIAGVDNGDPVSHAPFKASERKAFNGLALVVIQSTTSKGKAVLQASSEGLQSRSIEIVME